MMINANHFLSEEQIIDLADFFKLFADSTRAKILLALVTEELRAGDLASQLAMSKSLVSHQLRKLRENSLVRARKEGKNVFYSLDDDHVRALLKMAVEHLAEMPAAGN